MTIKKFHPPFRSLKQNFTSEFSLAKFHLVITYIFDKVMRLKSQQYCYFAALKNVEWHYNKDILQWKNQKIVRMWFWSSTDILAMQVYNSLMPKLTNRLTHMIYMYMNKQDIIVDQNSCISVPEITTSHVDVCQ